MRLCRGVFMLAFCLFRPVNASIQEGTLGFSGTVTEPTCVLLLPEQNPVRDRSAFVADLSPGMKISTVNVTLRQCPEKVLSGALISIQDIGGSHSPEFIHKTGEKVSKGYPVEPYRFVRNNEAEVLLPLIVSFPVAGADRNSAAIMHIKYD